MGCLNCGKELVHTPGKKAKKFCNNSCRSGYGQRKKKGQMDSPKRRPGRPKKETIPLPDGYGRLKKVKAVKPNGEVVSFSIPSMAEKDNRKVINPGADRTKQMKDPEEGTPAHFIRYGAYYKKDIPK